VTRQAETRRAADAELHDHDRGLLFDLTTLIDRRQLIKLIAGASLVPLLGVACGGEENASTSPSGPATEPASVAQTSAVSDESCAAIPGETGGPFPGDGTNGPNVLAESGIVRSDIRTSFGSSSGIADGTSLTINLTIVDTASGCAPLRGAAVYLWHCDREGRHSLYSDGATGENYLRGLQETDDNGVVTFTSVFPACYQGRWPHIHFEVYSGLDAATSNDGLLLTSQLAMPPEILDHAYAADGYGQSVTNLSQVSLETDNVFADGYELELATVTGSVDDGYVAGLTVGV
jgi:protocatechuate 3,4-dioxygenase beta subunit